MKDQDHLLAVIEALRGEVRSLGARVGEWSSARGCSPALPRDHNYPAVQTRRQRPRATSAKKNCSPLRRDCGLPRRAGENPQRPTGGILLTWAQVGRVHIQASHRVH